MMDQLVYIACTRLLDEAVKAEALKKQVQLNDDSFLNISYPDHPLLVETLRENVDPIVFTSIHAVKAVQQLINKYQFKLKTNLAFCITGKTALCAVKNGFSILDEAVNASLLANKIIRKKSKSVLHCTANIRRNELVHELLNKGIRVKIAEVYHKELVNKKVLKFDGVMFFSPSQVDAFLSGNMLLPHLPAFCIGATTAKHLASLNHSNIITSNISNEQALLEQVYKYYKIKL